MGLIARFKQWFTEDIKPEIYTHHIVEKIIYEPNFQTILIPIYKGKKIIRFNSGHVDSYEIESSYDISRDKKDAYRSNKLTGWELKKHLKDNDIISWESQFYTEFISRVYDVKNEPYISYNQTINWNLVESQKIEWEEVPYKHMEFEIAKNISVKEYIPFVRK